MKSEKQTKISSVHFKYVGTDEQFSDFIRSVIKENEIICLVCL